MVGYQVVMTFPSVAPMLNFCMFYDSQDNPNFKDHIHSVWILLNLWGTRTIFRVLFEIISIYIP